MSVADTLPGDSGLHDYMRPRDFMDCFSVEIANSWARETASMLDLAELCFSINVPGADPLMKLRNLIVKPFGLKTADDMTGQSSGAARPRAEGDRIGFFRIYSVSEHEIILGEDDIHQDFRVSLYRTSSAPGRLFAATCCRRHNLFGHLYLATILPFHKMIVMGMLDGLAKKLEAAGDGPIEPG